MSNRDDERFFDRRKFIKTTTYTTIGLGIIGINSVTAKPGGGPPDTKSCDIIVPDDYLIIQDAVDNAEPGDNICIKDGAYKEQIIINKDLTLKAAGEDSPTIEHPSSPDSFTIPESGPTWEPIIFVYGGTETGGEISGSDTVDVDIYDLKIDGLGLQPDVRRKPGIFYRNASGKISDNIIENMGVGGKETFGILAYGDSNVTIKNNKISDYERGGIGANGDGGKHPGPNVDIINNTLKGPTGIGEAWGPNGIQIGFGAKGKVIDNKVLDNRYSDEDPVASGILIFESDNVDIKNNIVEKADIALSCGSWGWLRKTANNNKFTGNQARETEYGNLFEAVAEPYDGVLTQNNPTVNNNKSVRNTLRGEDDPKGQIGIGIIAEDNIENEYSPVADNNKIINNDIENFETRIEDGGSDTKIAPMKP